MWVQGRRGGKAETEVLGLSNDDGGFPGGSGVKNLPTHVGDVGLIPGLGRFPWKRKWQPTPVFLPGKPHGQRSLAGYSLWDLKSQTWLSD